MAEERLIDDDLNKDKKYRIRKNADGEDELYVDDSVVEPTLSDEEFEELSFEVPEEEDIEDSEILTPEELAAREQARRKLESLEAARAREHLDKSLALFGGGDSEGALKELAEAEKLNPNGETAAAKLRILTSDFTDYSKLDECAELVKKVASAGEQTKSALAALSKPFEEEMIRLEEHAAALHVEVEAKKAERRDAFLAKRKKWLAAFTATAVPFLACFIVAMAFVSVMHARADGLNITLAIVFGALSSVLFIASLFTVHKLWDAMRLLSLNEKNSSTKIGREYEETSAEAQKIRTVLSAFRTDI